MSEVQPYAIETVLVSKLHAGAALNLVHRAQNRRSLVLTEGAVQRIGHFGVWPFGRRASNCRIAYVVLCSRAIQAHVITVSPEPMLEEAAVYLALEDFRRRDAHHVAKGMSLRCCEVKHSPILHNLLQVVEHGVLFFVLKVLGDVANSPRLTGDHVTFQEHN